MSEEINVTYETLFDLLRRERTRGELQSLSDSFFSDTSIYINTKKKAMENADINIQKKTAVQFESIKKILKELYEKRERKIIEMALTKSRTDSDIIDQSRLLGQELEFFNELTIVCDKYRKEILSVLLKDTELSFEQPKQTSSEAKPEESEKSQESQETSEKSQELEKTSGEITDEKPAEPDKTDSTEKILPEKTKSSQEPVKDQVQTGFKKVKFLQALPRFVGKEREPYGPYDADETAELPVEIADILVKKGRAEEA